MKYYYPSPVTISAINAGGWDADLTVPAGKKIEVNSGACVGTVLAGAIMTLGVD